MKLNQKINKNNTFISAKSANKMNVETKDNKITFFLPKNAFNFNTYRIISTNLLKLAGKSITFDLSSFLNVADLYDKVKDENID